MEIYVSILFFCFVTSITPGPNSVMLMASGVNHGARKSLPHYLGIVIGFPLMVAAIGFGLSAVFVDYPVVHQTIKLIGTAYLVFLSWKIANASSPSASQELKAPFTFSQALVYQWLNPKAWVISVGAIATFTSLDNIKEAVVVIVLGYIMAGVVSMALWLFVGVYMQRFLSNKSRLKYFNIFMAILLLGSLAPMVLVEISAI